MIFANIKGQERHYNLIKLNHHTYSLHVLYIFKMSIY